MASKMSQVLLPKELMELQLAQIDLLMAMYASEDAVAIDDVSLRWLESLHTWCENDGEESPQIPDFTISITISVALPDDEQATGNHPLQLELSVPLSYPDDGGVPPTEPPKIRTRLRQPEWMSKADVNGVNCGIPDEDTLTAIEHVREAASLLLSKTRQTAAAIDDMDGADAQVTRVWFYFPSISTRSKRDDLVNYAPVYSLTGFLLAGKPGVLCLEGGAQAIDDYMKFIKTESWGDIPSQHKKVSERYREAGSEVARVFEDMREITDDVGERRGTRANRNDMKAVEAWLRERGVGEALAKVLI